MGVVEAIDAMSDFYERAEFLAVVRVQLVVIGCSFVEVSRVSKPKFN
jgi:hypothetical protein